MILQILSMYVEKTSLMKAINHIVKIMNSKKLNYTGQGSINCCILAPMYGILVMRIMVVILEEILVLLHQSCDVFGLQKQGFI